MTANPAVTWMECGGVGSLHPCHDCGNTVFIALLYWKRINKVIKTAVLTERRCGRNLSMSFMSMPSSSSNLFILKERNHQGETEGQSIIRAHTVPVTQGLGLEPNLTPLCLCAAGALAFLSGVSCGNGWSRASPAARPNLHPYNREQHTRKCKNNNTLVSDNLCHPHSSGFH